MALIAALNAASSLCFADIIPDGGTNTNVSSSASGKLSVQLAPLSTSGISHNTYNKFSVGPAGADFVNLGLNARLIVNEVTSANPSLIEGPITVVGPAANFVLANPNGITVNGGRFINTGRVALTTGSVSFIDLTPAPGINQRNVVLTTSAGHIEIGPSGLAGTMGSLDLIAKSLRINGRLENTFSSGQARARVVAGSSVATLNSAVSPLDFSAEWMNVTGPATANAGAVLVDITPMGSLQAGRVEIMVTDAGAGVRHAGSTFATHGDFTVSASGDVLFAGARVEAHQDVDIQAASTELVAARIAADGGIGVHALGGTIRLHQSDVSAQHNVFVEAQDIILEAGSDAGLPAVSRIASSLGSITAQATGSISLQGGELVAQQDVLLKAYAFEATPDAHSHDPSRVVALNGGVLVEGQGDITNSGSLMQGARRIGGEAASLGAVSLVANGGIVNETLEPTSIGVIFGLDDDVTLTAGGDIFNRAGRIISNGSLKLDAGGEVLNVIEKVPGSAGDGSRGFERKEAAFLFFKRRVSGYEQNFGQLAVPDQLAYLVAEDDIEVQAHGFTSRGGEINANTGDLRVSVGGVLLNEAVLTGAYRYESRCLLFCSRSASSSVQAYGGLINAGGDIELTAGSEIRHEGGRILALHDLSLTAPSIDIRSVTTYSAQQRSSSMSSWFGSSWGRVYAADQGGSLTANIGRLQLDGMVIVRGATLFGAAGVISTTPITVVQEPAETTMTIEDHLGLFDELW